MGWERANIQAAASYLRDRIAAGATDSKTTAIYEGLLEVLDPQRRVARLQREILAATQHAVPLTARERRSKADRRRTERRQVNLGSPTGAERRGRRDRRTGGDRRTG